MTDGMERRDFIRSAGLLAGAAAVAIDSPALAQTTSNAGFKAMTYEIKPLSRSARARRWAHSGGGRR